MYPNSLHKLFWIGSPFFSPALEAAGWQVQIWNFEDIAVYGWEDLVALAGWEPDVVVVADKSRPPFVLGIESFPCVTVFYCVDSHIHSYYPLYAQAFDVCLLSLKDHLPLFAGKELSPDALWWFPPFAPDCPAPAQEDFIWDCLFVGNVDTSTFNARADFMQRLGQEVNLHIARGDFYELFPKGRILLNHCAAGDMNFRVFEALGCGGCLLSPAVGHGQGELFTENVHLVTYPSNDVAAAAAQARRLLADQERQQALRTSGLACIDAGHRAQHRAAAFTHRIHEWYAGEGKVASLRRRKEAPRLVQQWLRLPYMLFAEHLSQPLLQQAYVQAAQGKFRS